MLQRQSSDNNIRVIEWHLSREQDIREAMEEYQSSACGKTGGAPSGKAHISNPTEIQALKNIIEPDKIQIAGGGTVFRPCRWLAVIDATRAFCQCDRIRAGIFFRRYRLCEHMRSTCHELPISETTYYVMLSEIRNFARAAAAQEQLIKIF